MKGNLSYKIENLYVNSKLNIDIESTISNIYKKICNTVISLLKKQIKNKSTVNK